LIDMEFPLTLQDGNWNWTLALSQRAIVDLGHANLGNICVIAAYFCPCTPFSS